SNTRAFVFMRCSLRDCLADDWPRPFVRRRDQSSGTDQSDGAARYGNELLNGLSFAFTLSVQSGNAPGAQLAPAGLSRLLKIAYSPMSTTSSVSFRPP